MSRLWCCLGLALALLVACLRLSPSESALEEARSEAPQLLSRAARFADDGALRLVGAQSHDDAPWSARRSDRNRPLPPEPGALETETEDEDTKSEPPTCAPLFELVLSVRDCGARRSGHAVDTGHLLVGTGLARGPPLA